MLHNQVKNEAVSEHFQNLKKLRFTNFVLLWYFDVFTFNLTHLQQHNHKHYKEHTK